VLIKQAKLEVGIGAAEDATLTEPFQCSFRFYICNSLNMKEWLCTTGMMLRRRRRRNLVRLATSRALLDLPSSGLTTSEQLRQFKCLKFVPLKTMRPWQVARCSRGARVFPLAYVSNTSLTKCKS
jgi:hypothetical protein